MAWRFYAGGFETPNRIAAALPGVYQTLLDKYRVDELYGALFVRGLVLGGGRALHAGARFVVDGGETFNPSIYDLLAAIHEVPAEEVLVFPNNPNVVMAAERAAELSDKKARVVGIFNAAYGVLLSTILQTDLDDRYRGRVMSIFTLVLGSVMMANRVTSLPVPAVVFRTTSGSRGFLILPAPL